MLGGLLMSEKDVIENTIDPITKDRIIFDLRQAGIVSNDTLLVHSSLSKMGFVIGKEITVVDALLEALNYGTLVMPSQSGDNSDPSLWKNPPVPEEWVELIKEHTPSYNKKTFSTRGMGRVVECFRNYPKVRRSNHPQVSFLAKGHNARYITRGHQLTPSFGSFSPLGRLYDLNAKVLLIGVSYENATVFHYAEYLSGVLTKEKQGARMKDKWVEFEDYAYTSEDFESLGKAFEREGFVQKVMIGQAPSLLFRTRDAVDFGKEWIAKTRNQKADV